MLLGRGYCCRYCHCYRHTTNPTNPKQPKHPPTVRLNRRKIRCSGRAGYVKSTFLNSTRPSTLGKTSPASPALSMAGFRSTTAKMRAAAELAAAWSPRKDVF